MSIKNDELVDYFNRIREERSDWLAKHEEAKMIPLPVNEGDGIGAISPEVKELGDDFMKSKGAN